MSEREREPLSEEAMVRVERLLDRLTKPTFVWRMARGCMGPDPVHQTRPLHRSAATRRAQALAEVDALIRSYAVVSLQEQERGS